jgi:hypothetical protein
VAPQLVYLEAWTFRLLNFLLEMNELISLVKLDEKCHLDTASQGAI